LNEPREDVDACLARMVQRCEEARQQAKLRVRQVLDSSYAFERMQIQQVDARPYARLQPVREDASRRGILRLDGIS
jgi:hypothetical protein